MSLTRVCVLAVLSFLCIISPFVVAIDIDGNEEARSLIPNRDSNYIPRFMEFFNKKLDRIQSSEPLFVEKGSDAEKKEKDSIGFNPEREEPVGLATRVVPIGSLKKGANGESDIVTDSGKKYDKFGKVFNTLASPTKCLPDGNTVCPVGTCPMANAVCCMTAPKHCCPQGYMCMPHLNSNPLRVTCMEPQKQKRVESSKVGNCDVDKLIDFKDEDKDIIKTAEKK